MANPLPNKTKNQVYPLVRDPESELVRMTESVKGIEVTEDSQKKELIVVVAQQQIEVGGTVLYLENEVGSYSVQLVCSNNNNSSEGTPPTPQPTTTTPPHNVLYLVMGTVI